MTTNAAECPIPSLDDLPPTLTVTEACAIARISRRQFQRWVEDDRFQTWRPIAAGSGRRLVDRSTFLAFLKGE